ncbi:MAG TPA: ATP-binding protein [Dehalococcoidia bacterium]|nr:ATP-binding protein [Dehalococcoidia bacterium]
MPKRFGLSFKLALAFLGVSAVTLVLALVLIDRLTTEGFRSYLTHNEMMRSVMPEAHGLMGPDEQDFIGRLRLSLILAGLGGAFVATVAGLVVAGYITRPLRLIEEAARSVARGDTLRRAHVTSNDELGDLAASFNTMADSLAGQERTRQQFIADVSHELRTPLTVLQGEIEALQDGVTRPSKERLESLYEETQLLNRLVDDLRTLSLADAGELTLQIQTEPVADILRRGGAAMAETAARENVELKLDLAPDLPAVTVDAHRISQVLINLLSNAIRHTPPGGEVCVSAELTGSVVRVHVKDSGSGMPVEALPHVFDRFYRVDPSRSRSSGGSGLGLAISRQLVHAHGGDIWAENNQGPGASFTFTIPVARAYGLKAGKHRDVAPAHPV